jgi:micrococcal nuclease
MDKYIYRGKLERVVDGDTIDALIDVGFDIWVKKRIRYKGIDTWESRTRNLDEKKKGLAAKARNKELLEKVSSKPGYFRLKSYGVGKYGRVLGEIFIQDTEGNQFSINSKLINEGHAYVYEGGKKKVFTENKNGKLDK